MENKICSIPFYVANNILNFYFILYESKFHKKEKKSNKYASAK